MSHKLNQNLKKRALPPFLRKNKEIFMLKITLQERYSAVSKHMLEYEINDENSVFLNAAIALQTIAAQHPFVNGNKRTEIATSIVISKNKGK